MPIWKANDTEWAKHTHHYLYKVPVCVTNVMESQKSPHFGLRAAVFEF